MKPEGKVFDSSWRTACEVKRINRRDVESMIEAHYLARWPQDTWLVLALVKNGTPLGCAVWAAPPTPIAARFPGEVWELARLWVHKRVPTNGESFLIGRSLRYIKRHHPTVVTAVSFADPEHGHSGTIYRASNWTPCTHGSKNLFSYTLK